MDPGLRFASPWAIGSRAVGPLGVTTFSYAFVGAEGIVGRIERDKNCVAARNTDNEGTARTATQTNSAGKPN